MMIGIRAIAIFFQLVDQRLRCIRWQDGIVNRADQPYLWSRCFYVATGFYITYALRNWYTYDAFTFFLHVTAALQFLGWNAWYRQPQDEEDESREHFDDTRRLPAFRNAMVVGAILESIAVFYNVRGSSVSDMMSLLAVCLIVSSAAAVVYIADKRQRNNVFQFAKLYQKRFVSPYLFTSHDDVGSSRSNGGNNSNVLSMNSSTKRNVQPLVPVDSPTLTPTITPTITPTSTNCGDANAFKPKPSPASIPPPRTNAAIIRRLSQTYNLVGNISLLNHERKALSMSFLPARSRRDTLMTRVIIYDKTSHHVMDKVAIVIFQELLWFSVVVFGECCMTFAHMEVEWCTFDVFTLPSNTTTMSLAHTVTDAVL